MWKQHRRALLGWTPQHHGQHWTDLINPNNILYHWQCDFWNTFSELYHFRLTRGAIKVNGDWLGK